MTENVQNIGIAGGNLSHRHGGLRRLSGQLLAGVLFACLFFVTPAFAEGPGAVSPSPDSKPPASA
ncbi:MAG: hypothetical protein ISP99_05500, partial [Pseudomonadales bacterium]|nr:hypothetical protein [Pseudomonadales bacterium]